MSTCETCGNDYDKAFQVVMNGQAHTFSSGSRADILRGRRWATADGGQAARRGQLWPKS